MITFLGPCPNIAGGYNDRTIMLDIENTLYSEYFLKNGRIIPFNGTVDKACKGTVMDLNTYNTYGFECSKDMCKISWSNGAVSIKTSCL